MVFLSVSILSHGQKLTYKQLLKLRQLEKSEIGNYLQKRGWQAMSDNAPSDQTMGKSVWAYNPTGENAVAWCILYYTTTSPNRILYNFTGIDEFKKISRKVEKQSERQMGQKSALENVQTYEDYLKGAYAIRLFEYTQPNYYGIKIFLKDDYQKAKLNGRL
jgi:hypothetical protein